MDQIKNQQQAESSSEEEEEEKKPFVERIIIDLDCGWKQKFDVTILLLVGYSCFTTLFYVAFGQPTNMFHLAWDLLVEYTFYTDFLLNFLQEYYDQDTQERVKDLKKIANKYFSGWFFVDFVSIFPFGIIFDTGVITKLFRLCRLPRLIKLISIERFKKVLKGFQKEDSDDKAIVQEYFTLYIYNLFRLVLIAIMVTYFIGCIVFFISNEFNDPLDVENLNTFNTNFQLYDYESNKQRLVVCSYFALTMLSTVGYGDYYPISNLEKQSAVVIMLCGVAFFSFIMGSFIEIISNYDKKMGSPDKMPDLNIWLISLQRFNSAKPLNQSFVDDVTKNQQYFWNNDRKDFLMQDEQFSLLPKQIVFKIMSNYLFADVFSRKFSFFDEKMMNDGGLLYAFAFGMIPRKFDGDDPQDKILCEEG